MSETERPREAVYYFGCWDRAGHYLHAPSGKTLDGVGPFYVWDFEHGIPLDGTFAPGPYSRQSREGYEDEYAASLTHIRGWSVLAMWDRSVDARSASNAAFIAEGFLTMEAMWSLARTYFPRVVARLKAAPKERA
jgi:hypothetical protein